MTNEIRRGGKREQEEAFVLSLKPFASTILAAWSMIFDMSIYVKYEYVTNVN